MGINHRKNQLKQMRQEDILDAAERVFFSKGYQNATMDDIARDAEYSKRTIYVYFDSKEQLYQGIIYRAFRVLNAMNQTSLKQCDHLNGLNRLRTIGDTHLEFIRKYPNYFRAITNHEFSTQEAENESPVFKEGEKAIEILFSTLETGVKDGSIRADIDITATSFILYSQIIGFGTLLLNKNKYFTDVYHQTESNLAEELNTFISNSLKV